MSVRMYVLDEETFGMVDFLVTYVAEAGFEGFLAHVDQRVAKAKADCSCGGTHDDMPEPNRATIRGNLDRLVQALEEVSA